MGLSPAVASAAYALPVAILLVFNIVTGLALGRGLPLGPTLVVALFSQARSGG